MHIPTEQEIVELHRKYAPSVEAYQSVYTHCQIVWKIANQLIKKRGLTLNADLVRAGALLHDIGVYEFWTKEGYAKPPSKIYVSHAVIGADILKHEGLPKDLQKIVSNHLGVGISKEDIVKHGLDLPKKDMIPTTLEERLVSYADSYNTKAAPPHFRTAGNIKKRISLVKKEKVSVFEAWVLEFGIPELKPLMDEYRQILID